MTNDTHFMFCRRFIRPLLATIGAAILLGSVMEAGAAEPDAASKTYVEIPHVAFLTLMLARDPAIHDDLRLSREQRRLVDGAVLQVDQPMWLLRDVPLDKCKDQLHGLLGQLRELLKKAFKEEQLTRFDQIVAQARGYRALSSDDVAGKLNLSDEQRKVVNATLLAQTASAALPSKPAAKQGGKKGEPNLAESVQALLSDEQQAVLAEQWGPTFDFRKVKQIGCNAPELRGVEQWINSNPLSLSELRGKVVVVHFWAFGCINCVHNLPHYQGWYQKFPAQQFAIIGVHTPETDRERSVENLRQNIEERGIQWPVAVDAQSENWKAWANNIWPAVYLIDKQGRVRYWWYGELNWQGATGEQTMRKRIQQLIAEK